jgi:drug/metabolite transporter (DMT)-like permease
VVLGRLGGGGLLLAVPLVVVVARGWRPRAGHLRAVAVYGLVPLAGAQVCYFSAVGHLSVGVALLIEYTAPVLLLGWSWARTAARPRPATLLGAAAAVGGLVLVLDVGRGAAVDVVGVLWGLGAAVCLAAYFQLSAGAGDGAGGPPAAVGRLGSRFASFVGLSEVLFAVLGAWWLVAQRPTTTQVVGGALVVAAIALIRWAEPPGGTAPSAEVEDGCIDNHTEGAP